MKTDNNAGILYFAVVNCFYSRIFLILISGAFALNSGSVLGQSLSMSLNPSNYQGFNISCFGAHDGNIDLTVNNGIAPYTYDWSNGNNSEDINGLAAGYYIVRVIDANGMYGWSEITLKEPEPFLRVTLTSYIYPNGYNISCSNCSDGIIATSVEQGIPPYTFEWNDGEVLNDRTNLHSGVYAVIVTDDNGCTVQEQVTLFPPEREDWTVYGNNGINPDLHFIGTMDSSALVLKTNSTERVRVKSDGNIQIPAFDGRAGLLYVDHEGVLQSANKPAPCNGATSPVWYTSSASPGNIFTCPSTSVGIGTYEIPAGYRLVVMGKVGVNELWCSLGNPWPDFVFERDYKLRTLSELKSFVEENKHLPEMQSSKELEGDKVMNVGAIQIQQQQKLEEAYLYIFQLKHELDALNEKVRKLSNHNSLKLDN